MAGLQTPLLAVLIFLALALQATEAGEAGEREGGSPQYPGSDPGASSSCPGKNTGLRTDTLSLPLAFRLVPLLLWASVYISVK